MAQRRTVSDLRENVSAILTGADLDLVNNLYGAFERAAGVMVQKADVPETMVRQSLMLYNGVTDYAPTENMFGAALIDLRPQGIEPSTGHNVKKTFIVEFDGAPNRVPSGYLVSFEYRKGDPIMRIAQGRTTPRVVLDPMTDTTGWSVAGDANTLLLDTTVYYHQPAALRFNLAAGGTQGTLEKTLDNPLDLSSYEGVGVIFLAAYFPDASVISSVTMRLGSDSANYYEVTVTEGFLGALYSNDYQLIAFNLANATTVGSPDITAIQYVDVITNYLGGSPTYGSELVTNGTFDGSDTGWTADAGWAYGSNNEVFTGGVANKLLSQPITFELKTYAYEFDAVINTGELALDLYDNLLTPMQAQQVAVANSTGHYSGQIDISFDIYTQLVFVTQPNFDGSITNVSIQEVISEGTAQNNVRYGDLFISLPSPHEALFYSAAVFLATQPEADDYSIYITNDQDEIIFRDAAYNIFQYEAARAVAQNQGAGIGSATIAGIDQVLEGGANGRPMGLYTGYRGDNPSEELRQVGSYYDGIQDGPGYIGGIGD